MPMREQDYREMESICEEIWLLTRSTLSLEHPFLSSFFAGFIFIAQWEKHSVGTDGRYIYYHPETLMEAYRRSPDYVERLFGHMVSHCLFLHPLRKRNSFKNAGNEKWEQEEHLWNLACDMAADHLHLFEKEGAGGKKEIRPESIYEELKQMQKEELEALEGQYRMDDHSWWKQTDEEELLQRAEQQWDRMEKYSGNGAGAFSDSMGCSVGDKSEQISFKKKKKQDFRLFLKRFAVSGEEMQMDPESFDYIPYVYGMERYGNMPLVEELEYREVQRIAELVIAIDTSGSCSAHMVRRFMEETYGILSDRENFFRKMNLYIIQCDCFIQNVAHITSEEDWKAYLDSLTIEGRSGTDFRPVFQYVEELRRKKELKRLKGLLYFTDGDGIYPEKAPDYETAFIFYREKACHQQVPFWAVRLTMEDEGEP